MKKTIAIITICLITSISANAQKWYQAGFKISTNFLTNRDYSVQGDYINGLVNADFGFFFRAGKYVYGEVGLGYAFYKGDFSNEAEGFSMERVETRHLQIPVKIVGDVPMGRSSDFLPFVGIIYQPLLQVTDNNCGYTKKPTEGGKMIEKNMTLLTAGFDFKFGPIVLGVNYRYGLQTFFRNIDGKHPQYVNICAGFQF